MSIDFIIIIIIVILLIFFLSYNKKIELYENKHTVDERYTQFSENVVYNGNNLFKKGNEKFSDLRYLVPDLDIVDHTNALKLYKNNQLTVDNFKNTLPK